MSKLRVIATTAALTAALCLPLGAFADMMLKGHPHLQRAHHALHEALDEINASQRANEHVWGDEGGHGREAKEEIEKAAREIDRAAEWASHH